MEAIMQLENISKKFRKNVVFDCANLTVNRGDIVGLVGINGSGKTTIFKIITGLLRAKGSVKVFGLTLKEKRKIFEKLMVVFDSSTYIKDMTAYDILRTTVNLYGNFTQEEIYDALAEVGLAGREREKAASYSLGMKQRLNLAKILLVKPEIVLMDEPFNGVDIVGVEFIIETVKRLNREAGMTFIVSSHHIDELERFCNRIVGIGDRTFKIDKYIDEMDMVTVSLKVDTEENAAKVAARYNVTNTYNGVMYIAGNKGIEDDIIEFLSANGIKYTYFNSQNAIRGELMSIIDGGRNA